jgi:hypothetical protein
LDSTDVIGRDAFFSKRAQGFPKYEEVTVEGLGRVWVKRLNAGEKDRFEQQHLLAEKADFRARVVTFCAISEQGARLFADEDIHELTLFDPDILDPIVQAASHINGWSEKEQEELAKNLNGQAVNS